MQYNIEGGMFPILEVSLSPGESIITQNGGMIWMSPNLKMETKSGGVGKAFSKMFSGEKMFQNKYIANRPGEIAFASSFPGSIRAVEVTPDKPVVAQKGAFLASYGNIEVSVFFQKKLGAGFFGGEGFLMQKYSGNGIVFLEIDGSAIEYDIPAGDKKIVDTGYLAAMDASCTMEVVMVKGVKNIFLGGEGLFNTVVNGPGHIILQTMPVQNTATILYNYMPHPSSN